MWQKKFKLKGRDIPWRSARTAYRTWSGLSNAHASEPSAPVDDTLRAKATESDPAMGAWMIGISSFKRSTKRRSGLSLHIYIVSHALRLC